MKPNIVFVGPLVNRTNPELTGGAVVLFQNLLEELNEQQVLYLVVDTNKKNYTNIVFAYISICFQIFWKQFRVDHISLHSSRDYLLLMPFIIGIAKLFGKKTSLRKFGGEAWDTYRYAKGIRKKILHRIFTQSDFLFLEMKFLVENFQVLNRKTFWFPNVRPNHNIQRKPNEFRKRFVFMSHVKREKGIDEIIEVIKRLDQSYTIDIFGVIDDTKYSKRFFEEQGISYKGALKQNEVLNTLSLYDVLLLPSYKEGYPGIVIESYSLGLPIISTKLKGLEEITDQYQTGILIEPRNAKSLEKAIRYFSVENYSQFSENAKKKSSLFNRKQQTKIFLDIISKKETVCKKFNF